MTGTLRRLAALSAVLVAGLPLGGCISLLPKQPPVQMYRLQAENPAKGNPGERPSLLGGDRVGIVLARVELPRAAAGDRMLAVTGQEAAYIAKARWVSPAAVLFEDALGDSFDAVSKRVRLFGRGETGAASGALRVDVTAFEVRYPAPGAAPTAHLEARAVLLRRDGSFAAEQRFSADTPARENGVAAIAEAMSQSTYALNTAMVAWTDANADAAAAPSAALPAAASVSTPTTTTRTARTRGRS